MHASEWQILKSRKYQVLMKVWRNENTNKLLKEVKLGAAVLRNKPSTFTEINMTKPYCQHHAEVNTAENSLPISDAGKDHTRYDHLIGLKTIYMLIIGVLISQ